MNCVVCAELEPDWESGSRSCRRCAGRLAGALRQIPVLVDELRGLGYVERDTRPGTRAVREGKEIVRVPAMADPVANLWPAGPMAGAARGPRAKGGGERSLPIAVDPTDLLLGVNHEAHRLHVRSVLGMGDWPDDQVGHLSAATILDGWVRDWASYLGENLPTPSVPVLSGWLLDRLPWALQHHPVLDEFAGDVGDLMRTLYGLCGHGAARPKLMEAVCPSCALATLQQPFPEAFIECATVDCGRVLTPAEYEEYVMDMRHEVTAQDVLVALNGGEPVNVDQLRFVVIEGGYAEEVDGEWVRPEVVGPFRRGELLVVNRGGREWLGSKRRLGSYPVAYGEFERLADALASRAELAGEAS